jgi:hypothetical protein
MVEPECTCPQIVPNAPGSLHVWTFWRGGALSFNAKSCESDHKCSFLSIPTSPVDPFQGAGIKLCLPSSSFIMAQPGATSSNSKNSSAVVVVVADHDNNNPHYHELKNNDSLMVSFDRTFNDDDDHQNNIMKDVPHYRDFARDIVATLKQHRGIQGCLEMILACCAIVTLYSTVLVYRMPWWWSVGGAITFLAVYFCVRTYLHTALCDALHQRIDEWKVLIYARTNYALEWVPPEDWWNIYPGVQFTPKSSSSTRNKNGAETAIPSTAPAPPVVKYYVKMARFTPPRDLSARTIQDSTARPPVLLLSSVSGRSDIEADDDDDDDDDDESDDDESKTAKAFFQFLGDAKAQLQLDQRAQLQRMVVVIVLTLIALWIATEDCDLVVRAFFITLVVFDLFDDCLVQHVLDQTDRTPRRLLGRFDGGAGEVEDSPSSSVLDHRKSTEYVVTYHVDQPWWGLRETYYTIARTPPQPASYRRPVE